MAIILHFSLFCPVVLLIFMIDWWFKVFPRALWEFYPLECWNLLSWLLGCHGNRRLVRNSHYFAFITHLITTLTWVEGLHCPLSLCIVSKKAKATFNQEHLKHCMSFHDNHQGRTTKSRKYNCHVFCQLLCNTNTLANTPRLVRF